MAGMAGCPGRGSDNGLLHSISALPTSTSHSAARVADGSSTVVTRLKPVQNLFRTARRRSPARSPAGAMASATDAPTGIPLESANHDSTLQSDRSPSLESATGLRKETQSRPADLPNLLAEVIFVLVCSFGLLFSVSQSTNASVLQTILVPALGVQNTQAPWLIGSFLLASGLSVVVSGSLADLLRPKYMMIAAFAWVTVWSVIGCFSISPSRSILFFVVRAMQGLACGTLSSVPISILGRVYKPGQRKNRVFATMGAAAPLGSLLGAVQGGALEYHLPWLFGSSAVICGVLLVATIVVVPDLGPMADADGQDPPTMKDFDYLGAALAVAGCACLLAGLTQGSPAGWQPYTYVLVIIGILLLAAFGFAERYVARPLVSPRLWTTPGFAPVSLAYFFGFGSFIGGYQFYAFRFWLTIQNRAPVLLAAYKVPDAIAGMLATFTVAKIMHRVAGHWILIAAMIFYAMGPVFFLWQQPNYSYWAVMPGVAMAALGPDLSFTASAVFITSSVERSYQGSAGSVLVTIQNMSAAVVTAIADSIAASVTKLPDGELDLNSLRATWWFGFALAMTGALICALALRMPKSEEKEHVS